MATYCTTVPCGNLIGRLSDTCNPVSRMWMCPKESYYLTIDGLDRTHVSYTDLIGGDPHNRPVLFVDLDGGAVVVKSEILVQQPKPGQAC